MKYSELVNVYERLESTQSKLEKVRIVADFLHELRPEEIGSVVLLMTGRVFPSYDARELGIAEQTMTRIIGKSTGFSAEDIEKLFAKKGDLGLVAEELLKKRKQKTLVRAALNVDKIFENLQKLPEVTGARSQERKQELVAELLASASPGEAKYLVRTVLGDLRIGVAEGIIRDAIVAAFFETEDKEKKKEATEAVDYAWNILSDFGEVAEIARKKGVKGLHGVRFVLGKPFQMMLALAADKIEDVIDEHGDVAIEIKYDGMRTQIHKDGDNIWVFTRRLEDITRQFPDIVEYARESLKAKMCIVDSEAWALDKKGKPLPFQTLSQRIQRKYDIEKMVEEVPVQVNVFDIVYLDGEMLLNKTLGDRRKLLEKIVKPIPKKFVLAEQLITKDVKKASEFYRYALSLAQEGVMVKVPSSTYVFGRHVGGWYKIKPIMETLDLVIVGATWGEGRRSRWLSSYVLACRDPETGKLLECGMLSTGLTEQQYENMTRALKPLIEEEKGKSVTIKPEIVIEAGYQEIQRSPTYASGYALRFPRLVRVRPDKGPKDADTLERVRDLYKSQGRRG